MARKQASGAKASKGRTDTTKVSREAKGRGETPPRAHRNDTGEAKQQRAGTPKTHPTRNSVSSRKPAAGRQAAKE